MSGQIWLVRHGQSQANAGAATLHPESIALTDLGHQQACSVAQRIAFVPHCVVVSPYTRTMDTARPLLDKLASLGVQVGVQEWPIQEFTYLSPVRCRGTTATDRRAWAEAYWERADPAWQDGDAAESFEQLMARVEYFTRQLSAAPKPAVVFGHGMFFKAFVLRLTGVIDASAAGMRRYRALESAAPIRNAETIRLQFGPVGQCTVLEETMS